MFFTAKYNQRLPEVHAVDFGSKATLESGSWQAFENDQVVVPASRSYVPPSLVHKTNTKLKRKPRTAPSELQKARLLDQQQHLTMNLETGEMEYLTEKNHNEAYRPYQGNMFVVGTLEGEQYLILPSGIIWMRQRMMIMHGEDTTWTSLKDSIGAGELKTAGWWELGDSIQQVEVSSAVDVVKANYPTMIVGIRTEYQTLLLRIERNPCWEGTGNLVKMTIIHKFKLYDSTHTEDLPRPTHIKLSPYTGQQYTLIDDRGHVKVFDIHSKEENGIIFEGDTMVKNEHLFSDRWKSCIFGPHPRTMIVATSQEILFLDFKENNKLPVRSIYECPKDQRIYCIGGLDTRNSFHYCVATDYHILLMDTRYPHQPVISWSHHLKDDPPRLMQLTKDTNNPDLVNITAWPSHTTSAIQLQYKYNGRLEYISSKEPPKITPALYSRPTYLKFNTHTSTIRGLIVPIPTTGTHVAHEAIKCKSTDDIKLVTIVFRLLSDGTLVSQVFMDTNSNEIHQSKNERYSTFLDDSILGAHAMVLEEDIKERTSNLYDWESRDFFQDVIQNAVLSKLSAPTPPLLNHPDLETSHISTSMSALVDPTTKKLLPLMSKHTLKELDADIQKQGYVLPKSKPGSINSLWDPIPGQENIGTLARKAISDSVCSNIAMTPTQKDTRKKLESCFSKDMMCHLSYYIQPQGSHFKYIRPSKYDDPDFTPSASTFLLGWDWIPGQDELIPPDLSQPLINHRRPLFYQNKLQHSTSSQPINTTTTTTTQSSSQPSMDSISQSASFGSVATQPVPGTFANRSKSLDPKKKKKKRKTVPGFM